MKYNLFFLIGLVSIILSCKKEVTIEPNSGIYRGVFSRIIDNTDTVGTGVALISLSTSDFKFTVSGDTATGVPKSSAGDFTIDSPTQMTFTNNSAIAPPSNPVHILDTTRPYHFNDHR